MSGSNSARKLKRFYIINPVGDRRVEQRFESREDVVIRFPDSGKMGPAVARDIGRMGLRLELMEDVESGVEVEIAFPQTPDNIRCFGRIVWTRRVAGAS